MGYTIAVTGKGGCGKTTISGLMISSLIRNGMAPVLAVDADPNSCLDSVMGVTVHKSVGTVREEARKIAAANEVTGVSKRELLELKISESLVEAEDFDLVAMGRSEGPGCYCYANNVLGAVIREISDNYPYVVIDNEAGLENLSRRIVKSVDLLVLVAEPSMNGLRTVARLYDLALEMGIEYRALAVVVNRVRGDGISAMADEVAQKIKADYTVMIPMDDEIAGYGEKGISLRNLPVENIVVREVDRFMRTVMQRGEE
ncbi:MAG TPA: AAA family ATPase [Spirochaetota bacterium]|nr:AAA family ATPase [Spirochaetota bacterium]